MKLTTRTLNETFLGKHSPAPGARSRSGESPHRPHSAQSWRQHRSTDTSLPKSRNGSLVSAKDSLSSKLRSSDSLSRLSQSSGNGSFGRGALRKTSTPSKWNGKDVTDKVRPKTTSSFWNFFKLHNGQT